MANIIGSGSLCPMRVTENGGIEVLLARRGLLNPEKDRPMRFAGEWGFAGGVYDGGDGTLVGTGKREFREELGYDGPITQTIFIRASTVHSRGETYYIELYSAQIDDKSPIEVQDGEVLEYRWFNPKAAVNLILSEEFRRQQIRKIKEMQLDDPRFGDHAVVDRELPVETIKALIAIQSMAGLREHYMP